MAESRPTACSGITLRPFQDHDIAFLYRVYAASRDAEMAMLADWSEAQKEQFLRQQFAAQHQHYQNHYPAACFDLILHRGEPIGRLYVAHMANEIRLIDIALLAEQRGRGIGAALTRELLDEATRVHKFVSLHVEENNPAKRLYERLGFIEAGEVTFYKLMRWVPEGHTPVLHDGGA